MKARRTKERNEDKVRKELIMAEDKQEVENALSSTSLSDTAEVGGAGEVNEKRLLRKLDLRLLPGVSILYLLSFLDRSNGKILSLSFFF